MSSLAVGELRTPYKFLRYPTLAVLALDELVRLSAIYGFQVVPIPLKLLAQFSALGFVHDDGGRSLFLMKKWDTPGTVQVSCDEDIFDYAIPLKSMATLVWGR